MEYTRQELVELLHRAGLPEVADAAARELPDLSTSSGFRPGHCGAGSAGTSC
jgi:hypothetical protein